MMLTHNQRQLLRAENALATVEQQNASRPCKHFERVVRYWTLEVNKLKDANNGDIHR